MILLFAEQRALDLVLRVKIIKNEGLQLSMKMSVLASVSTSRNFEGIQIDTRVYYH